MFFFRRFSTFRFSPNLARQAPFVEVRSPPDRKGGDFLDKKRKKRTIIQCDFLSPVIFDEIESGLRNRFIQSPVGGQPWFLDPRSGKSSLKTLRRKLNRFRTRDSSTRHEKNRVRSGELFRLIRRNRSRSAFLAVNRAFSMAGSIGVFIDLMINRPEMGPRRILTSL